MSKHFHRCLETGSNIRALEHGNTSTSASSGKCKFSFLCGSFDKRNYIYAVKFANHAWHYFEEVDSISTQHGSLPTSFDASHYPMNKVGTVTVELDNLQSKIYYKDGSFIFKDRPLKTYLTINGKPVVKDEIGKTKPIEKSTRRLVFISGETNPLFFLNGFEKCVDLKSDSDKMYRIMHFVDECHKGEFTKLYFNDDWASVKSKFLQLYTSSFVQNKKKNLDISFGETTSLRSFVDLKLTSLSKYTTLPFVNQIEMIMNDLPEEISRLFIVKEKMTGNKNEVLNFCDAIQDFVEATITHPKNDMQDPGRPSNRMFAETFTFQPENQPMSSEPSRGRGRGRGSLINAASPKKRKRQSEFVNENGLHEHLDVIMEESGSSENYDFSRETDNTSRSSWSE